MRIAYLSGAYIQSRGANSVHVMKMCQAFAGQGHQVTLYVREGERNNYGDFDYYGVKPCFEIVKAKRPQIRVLGALANARDVRRQIAARPLPELFYAREVYALAAVAQLGVPFVFECHWPPKNPVQRLVERWLFKRFNFQRIVFISEALRAIYLKQYPDLKDTVVAHDGADLVAEYTAGTCDAMRNGCKLRAGYVGALFPGRGIEIIVELAKRHEDMEFHIIGGNEDDLAYWRAVTRDAKNVFLHGFIPNADLGVYYSGLDVVLAPYQWSVGSAVWMSPMKIFEYMAYHKPIVCSDLPVVREILKDHANALLVSPDNIEAWSSALERLKSKELRECLGTQAFRTLEREFTWSRRAVRVLANGRGVSSKLNAVGVA